MFKVFSSSYDRPHSFIHWANCSKQNKIFQNLWHSTCESCQLQLLILKTKLKQKNLKLSLDEMHTKEKFNKYLHALLLVTI